MRIAGNYTFEATCEEVWIALNDPEVLARTIPGCQKLEQVGDTEYEGTLKIGLQAVKGVYHGRVRIEDHQPPHHYKLTVDGKGSNGFVKGEGVVNLREEDATTIMDYGGEAQVGGTIASVGQRLLDGAAKTLINQSLKALAAQIAARRAPVAPPAEAATEAPLAPLTNGALTVAEPLTPVVQPESVAVATSVSAAVSATPEPARDAAPMPAPVPAAARPTPERRSIVVPAHEQLTEQAVARGVIEDFVKERPWFPWVVVAFLVGYILGLSRKR